LLASAHAMTNHALVTGPHLAESHLAAGHLELHTGDPRIAAGHFRVAIALAPHLPDAHLWLGRLLLEAGFLADGVARLEEAIALAPRLSGARWEIARAWALEGRWGEHDQLVDQIVGPSRLQRERLAGFVTASGASVEPLTAGVPGGHLFAYRLGLGAPPGGAFTLAAQDPPGQALYFVRQGRVETTFGLTRLVLGEGDAAQGRLTCDHALRALGEAPAEVIAMLSRRIEEND